MGKYEPLALRLQQVRDDIWTAAFHEIEDVLGFALPASARTYREWWANQRDGGHSQTKGWQDAGWQVWKVDLTAESVTFRRVRPRSAALASGRDIGSEDGLIEQAGELLGIQDRAQIVREALHALIQREAARRLAKLGGMMPGFKPPPRRRSGR
jgi:hypothetical protein